MNLIQIIGLLLALIVPFVLLERKKEKKKINLQNGIILLILGASASAVSSSASKYFVSNNLNIYYYLAISYLMGFVFSKIQYSKTNHKIHNHEGAIKWGIISGTLMFLTFICFLKGLSEGIFVIVYSINAFSIMVPIILSVVIYKEKITIKKSIAILITIISLILLQ